MFLKEVDLFKNHIALGILLVVFWGEQVFEIIYNVKFMKWADLTRNNFSYILGSFLHYAIIDFFL